jgi:hypothetical protein
MNDGSSMAFSVNANGDCFPRQIADHYTGIHVGHGAPQNYLDIGLGRGSLYLRDDGSTDTILYVNVDSKTHPRWAVIDTSP